MGIDDAESGIGYDSGRAREKLVDDAEFPASGGSYYRRYRDIPGHVEPRIGDRRCIENSSPRPEHRLVVSPSWRPSESQTGTPVRMVRRNQGIGEAIVARNRQVSWRIRVAVQLNVRGKSRIGIACPWTHDGRLARHSCHRPVTEVRRDEVVRGVVPKR